MGANLSFEAITKSEAFQEHTNDFPIILGYTENSIPIVAPVNELHHILITGASGLGKSTIVHNIICGLVSSNSKDFLKIIVLSSNFAEYQIYNSRPFMLLPIADNVVKGDAALSVMFRELTKRQAKFSNNKVRAKKEYHKRQPDDKLYELFVVIDDYLSLHDSKKTAQEIQLLLSQGSSFGIHLIVVSPIIFKELEFAPTIIKLTQEEHFTLSSALLRLKNLIAVPYLDWNKINSILPNQEKVFEYDKLSFDYINAYSFSYNGKHLTSRFDASDPLLDKAIDLTFELGEISTSTLQRKLSLGYARSARIIDQLEELRIIGPREGSKPRKILLTKQQWREKKLGEDYLVEFRNTYI